MSPRIIQLPLSGRDRRHYVRESRAAEQAHRDLPARVEEAYRAAHALACEEWSVRQFIGEPATTAQAHEAIFLVRRSHPETNQCSIRAQTGRRAMTELITAAGVLFSISIFVAHAFDAYRTR
jgi:hypothetical protein